jgi:hypothetical protein
VKEGVKKKKELVEQEDESTLTHEEIEAWCKTYGVTGEIIFSLDALFWSLINIEKDEKAKRKNEKVGIEVEGPSIPLWVFLEYTKSLH